jgi:CBS domain-containing protein
VLSKIAATPITRLMPIIPICSAPDDTVGTAITTMLEKHCGATLVCKEDGALVGIFTERDLLLRSDEYSVDWLEQPVSNFMTSEPVSAQVSSTVSDVVAIMRAGGYRHVPVVDDLGRPRGIVSVRDILSFVAEHFPQEILNLPPNPSLEARSKWGG